MTMNVSEKSEMSCVEFCQTALQERVAPPNGASVKARINLAARRLGWPVTRTRDVWYADYRVSINAEELCVVERESGWTYAARNELRTNDNLLAQYEAILGLQDPEFHRGFLTALRATIGFVGRPLG